MKLVSIIISVFAFSHLYSQPLTASMNVTGNFGCSCSATITAIANGGVPPYTYYWNPSGQTTSVLINACDGGYSVTVTDASGNTALATTNVQTFFPLTACITWSNVSASCDPPFMIDIDNCSQNVAMLSAGQSKLFDASTGLLISTSNVLAPTLVFNDTGTFIYQIVIVNGNCRDTATAIIPINTSCDSPPTLSISDISSNSATVDWTNSGCAVKHRIRVKNLITGATTLQLVNAPATDVPLTGLSPSTPYQVKVRRQCSPTGAILSPWSNLITFTTSTSSGSSCTTPTNITATPTSNSTATFNWTNVTGANGFQLRYGINGTTTWIPIVINNGLATSTNISGLQPNTIYQYQLRTKCSVSPLTWSNYSAVQTFTTPLRIGESEHSSVAVYPNPSTGTVTFRSNGLVGTLFVYDAVGKTLRAVFVSSQLTEYPIVGLPVGLLTYRFVDACGETFGGKIAVVR